MERTIGVKYDNHSMMILETLIIFDVWLLIKIRWLIKKFIKVIIPLLKVMFFMTLGAVVLLAYVFLYGKFDINHKEDYRSTCKNYHQPMVNKYLAIDDDSRSETVNMRKELIRIKSESVNLERMLFRMNNHLKNMYDRQKHLDLNLADFASESVGGLVVDTPDTRAYFNPVSNQITIFGIPVWKANNYSPRKVIQPWIEAGECWAFHGSHGKIEIELAQPVFIERITLEHIPASASLTGNIADAPKTFNVLGKLNDEYVMIDSFTYNNSGLPSQTFNVKILNPKQAFKRVMLEILSNWGHPEYTCIYRFKVHGKMYDAKN